MILMSLKKKHQQQVGGGNRTGQDQNAGRKEKSKSKKHLSKEI